MSGDGSNHAISATPTAGTVYKAEESDGLNQPPPPALERYQTVSSVVIPKEVFESMYLSPYNRTHGDLRKVFGNPTPMSATSHQTGFRAQANFKSQAPHGIPDCINASRV